MRPFDHGADLIFHSATKFLCGHGTVVGGVLIDGGRFDWSRATRFPELNQPYAGFHGMVFSEESTVGAFLLRARREGLRDFGACMSPHTALLMLQGIETLPLRMARHVDNTRKVVAFLAAHAMVVGRRLPGARKPPEPRAGANAAAQRLRRRLQLRPQRLARTRRGLHRSAEAVLAPGQRRRCRSLVIHPASTTHFRMDDAALAAAGIRPGTIRLSIGLEDPDDLIDDLKRALKAASSAHEAHRSRHARPMPTPAASLSMPSLPTIVFVHGALNDHSVWTLHARWFAHHGFGVLALDLPGHMRSAGPALASVEAMADWLLAALDAAGVQRAALVGHSMGSLVALEAAARAPDRATRLLMFGTTVPMPVTETLLVASRDAPHEAIEMVVTYSFSTLAAKPSYPGPGVWLRGSARGLMRQVLAHGGDPLLFHTDFAACNDYRNGLVAAARVTCPAHLIARRVRPDDAAAQYPRRRRRVESHRSYGARRSLPDAGIARCGSRDTSPRTRLTPRRSAPNLIL